MICDYHCYVWFLLKLLLEMPLHTQSYAVEFLHFVTSLYIEGCYLEPSRLEEKRVKYLLPTTGSDYIRSANILVYLSTNPLVVDCQWH